ncbi:hypothetical protein E1A91_A13G101500v1, partial [Gossypium mustelinum]
DKRTRTADIRHRLTTFIVLCSPKSNSSQKVLSWNPILTKDSCGSDSLVLRMLVLRMSDCPSPTLTAQPESGQLMHSTY